MSSNDSSSDYKLSFSLDFNDSKNIFVFYFSGLFLQAYVLALIVSYLHARDNAVVCPLTAPDGSSSFTEYIIHIKTSLRLGASLDPRGRITIQLKGSFNESPPLLLQRSKNVDYFLRRGGINVFVYHSPTDLGDMMELEVELFNDTPYELSNVKWIPSYLGVHQPVSKKFWGCTAKGALESDNVKKETFVLQEKKRDSNRFVKCLMLFHMWISMFNCPVRVGMYNTLAHAIFVFFILSLMVNSLMLVYENTSNESRFTAGLFAVMCIWIIEMLLEAFIRNTVTGFRAGKDSLFTGLVEPSESLYNSDNFVLNYNWDDVRPLVMRNKVILVTGTKHPSKYSLFPVPRPYSVHNMWGLLSLQKEKESRLVLRILNECALPLPATMNWLGIEAAGRKEEILIDLATAKFKAPVCLFETWLLDWPLAYAEEPYVAGLIISHVMSTDLLVLMGIKHKRKRAHLAQLCVFQWHGMVCCILLFLIQFNLEAGKEASREIKNFISKTLTQFPKRSPREIKAAWVKRKQAKQTYNQRKSVVDLLVKPSYIKDTRESYAANLNTSSKDRKSTESLIQTDKLVFENDNLNGSESSTEGMTRTVATFRNRRRSQPTRGGNNNNGNKNQNAVSARTSVASRGEKLGTDEEPELPERSKSSIFFRSSTAEQDSQDLFDEQKDNAQTESMEMSYFESFSLGPPHMPAFAPMLDHDNIYLRYNNELLAYCCKNRRCMFFRQIHRKVGSRAMEVLSNAVLDLVIFSEKVSEDKKLTFFWKRRKMVSKMLEELKRKASLFEDKDFLTNVQPINEGFNCNRLLTTIHNNLYELLERITPPPPPPVPPNEEERARRCGFCAKILGAGLSTVANSCYSVDRLASFLAQGAIYVSEKELNSQLMSRYTVQNFCASVLFQARMEALVELEDPPLVMAGHVLQAMIHSLLNSLLPKQTDFHDLTADELRKIGTRLQRIKARYMTNYEEQNRTRDEKARVEKIKHFLHELGLRWQLLSPTRSLVFTAQLMAECLVQERVIGLSVYSGFISQEHVILLNGDREKLMEIESKATTAILKIARVICEPLVRDAVEINDDIDVIFTDKTRDLNYNVEKLSIAEYLTQPVFLATCVYYVADIISVKIREFKAISQYMNEWYPTRAEADPIPAVDLSFKFSHHIRLVTGYVHSDVNSPMLRWGDVVIKGEPPLAEEFIPARFQRDQSGDYLNDMFEDKKPTTMDEKLIAALIGAKRGVDNYNKTEEYDKDKRLQHHLARVQSQLMDQLAEASQAISHTTALDNDFVNEFHMDQLFNVELYACHKLDLPIATVFGVLVLIIMVALTLLVMFFTCVKGAKFTSPQVAECSAVVTLGLLAYGILFESLKCFIYALSNFYRD